MKIDLFKEKYLDLILIKPTGLEYFKIYTQDRSNFQILKKDEIKSEIFKHGLFNFHNFDDSLSKLLGKYKLNEVGIIIHTPNIFFKFIKLPPSKEPVSSIVNYLKINFTLPIERYSLSIFEDKYKSIGQTANYKVFLISKDIIENILKAVEKYNLLPLFISPSIEPIYQYFLNEAFLDFGGKYFFIIILKNLIMTAIIQNIRLEKLILEEIDLEKSDISFLIFRIYNSFKQELDQSTKIVVLSEEKIQKQEIPADFKILPPDILIKGSYLVYKNILKETKVKTTIDFLPIKNYKAYFLNRISSILVFISIYIILLALTFSAVFFGINKFLDKKITDLKRSIGSLNIKLTNYENLSNFIETTKRLEKRQINDLAKLEKILPSGLITNLSLNSQETIFSIKTTKDKKEEIIREIANQLPEVKLIEEKSINEEIELKYKF